jgi:hypothetical protein
MTQHMLIVLMATMVATFSGLIGSTGNGAAKRGDSGARGTTEVPRKFAEANEAATPPVQSTDHDPRFALT